MLIQGQRIFIGGQFIKARLEIENGIIVKVGSYQEEAQNLHQESAPVIDCGQNRLVPGFVDIHTHGAWGFDMDSGEMEGLRRWAEGLPWEGVTSFLPTTSTASPSILKRALENGAAAAKEQQAAREHQAAKEQRETKEQQAAGQEGKNLPQAQILGFHLEGPFLSPSFKGAQEGDVIVPPSREAFDQYQQAAGGMIRYVTLAPEEDRDFALTRYCASCGVTVSMGHSAADYQQALLAVANGVSSMTHVYNAMSGFHHRSPGLVGAALRIHGLYGEIICDGLHSHPAALNTFFSAKGWDFAIMVTDSLCLKGCAPGTKGRLGNVAVEMGKDGLARISGTEVIAGSTLSMNLGLKYLVEEAMVPFDQALNACTINPARCLGIEKQKGHIGAGCDADLVLLGEDYQVKRVWCRGREAKKKIFKNFLKP